MNKITTLQSLLTTATALPSQNRAKLFLPQAKSESRPQIFRRQRTNVGKTSQKRSRRTRFPPRLLLTPSTVATRTQSTDHHSAMATGRDNPRLFVKKVPMESSRNSASYRSVPEIAPEDMSAMFAAGEMSMQSQLWR